MVSPTEAHERFASNHLLARNSLLNLVVGGCVLLLNVAFVPSMLRAFGLELYGVLAITWMVMGHLRWLDMGFAAACARYVAQDLARGRPARAGQWAWTAVAMQALLGAIAAAVVWFSAPALADLLKIQPERREMVVFALRMFALVIPFDLSARSLNAVLEATQRFEWINAVTIGTAVWTYSTYAVGIIRDGDFRAVVYGLVALRVVVLVATFCFAGAALPSLRRASSFRLSGLLRGRRIREMFRFGGWVSLSSGVGPLLLFFDRWVISTIQRVAVLPLYTVPLQMLMSLQMIPGSIASTLFPAFSVLEANTRWDRVQSLNARAHRYLLLALIPIMPVLFLWAPEILRLWIGADFAAGATLPFQILVVGFAVGLFAPVSGALLQGAGRPDVLSKIYLAELPVNILLTVVLVRSFGVVGAAMTCAVRTVVETIILWVCVHRVFPLDWTQLVRGTFRRMTPVLVAACAFVVVFPGASIDDPTAVGLTVGALVAYPIYAYFHLLDAADLSLFRGLLRRARTDVPAEGTLG